MQPNCRSEDRECRNLERDPAFSTDFKSFFRKTYKRPRFSHLYIHKNAFIQSLILYTTVATVSYVILLLDVYFRVSRGGSHNKNSQTHQNHQSKLTVPILPVFALKVQKCTVLQKLDYFFFGRQH